jgi:TIR domain
MTDHSSTKPRESAQALIRAATDIVMLYSSTDLRMAADLRRRIIRLRRDRSGEHVFLAADSLTPAKPVSPELIRARIAGADLVVVACGAQTPKSRFVQEEVRLALEQRSEGRTEILPIILKAGVPLPTGLDFAVQAIHRAVLFPSIRWVPIVTAAVLILLAITAAFATRGADQSLTKRVRLRRAVRCFQDVKIHGPQ